MSLTNAFFCELIIRKPAKCISYNKEFKIFDIRITIKAVFFKIFHLLILSSKGCTFYLRLYYLTTFLYVIFITCVKWVMFQIIYIFNLYKKSVQMFLISKKHQKKTKRLLM